MADATKKANGDMSATSTRYVIVGNGIAAMKAAETIRSRDTEGDILLISDEQHPVYSRPLTAYLVGGWVSEERMPIRDVDHYERLRLTPVLGRKAVSVDSATKTVQLEGGESVKYDKLLLATGAAPKPSTVPGSHYLGVHGLRTWADSLEIKERLATTKNVVVVGGGFVGMSTARALLSAGVGVTVVVSSNRILSQTLPLEPAEIVRRQVESKGMRILTETDVVEILGDEKTGVTGVKLKAGDTVSCELVLVGKGVDPRLDLATSAGAACEAAISVDATMRTSVSGIWAAGDCTAPFDHLRAQRRSAAIWPNAAHQGRVAGANMTGTRYGSEGFYGMNALDFMGLAIIAGGITSAGEGMEALRAEGTMPATTDKSGNAVPGLPWFRQVVFEGDKLVGFVFVGHIERAGILNGLIRKRVPIRELGEAMLDPGFDMAKLPVALRKTMLRTVNPWAASFTG